MALTLKDFQNAPTEDQLFDGFLALLALAGLPVTSWHVGGVARTLARLVARGVVKVTAVIAAIATGGFNRYASGEWLSLLSRELYENDRFPATFAQGQVQLSLSSALAGPYTIVAEQLWFEWNGRRYRNTTGTPPGSPLTFPGTVTLSIKAESPGSLYNAPDNLLVPKTPLAGMVILASAISVQGTDLETDRSIQARNSGKWGQVGPAANDDGWEAYARAASAEVTRVLVLENTPDPGAVRVVVAGVAGALAAPTLATVNSYLDARRPLCVLVEAINATEEAVAVTGTVRILSSHPNASSALAQVVDALNTLLATIALGGTVRLSDLYAEIEGVPGVDSSLLSAPAADLVLGANGVPIPAITLTPVYV